MNYRNLIALLAGYGWLLTADAGECRDVSFSNGQRLVLRSASVKAVNALLESKAPQVFSVSVLPPTGAAFSGALSIVIEPSPGRTRFCEARVEMPLCATYRLPSNYYATVYFQSSIAASDRSLEQGLREYLDTRVLGCP